LGNAEFFEENREEIMRYVFMETLFVWKRQQWARNFTFNKVCEKKGNFPGREFYKTYQDHSYLIEELPENEFRYIPSPEKYEAMLTDTPWLLDKKRILVLWAQRQVISKWFPEYDPTIFAREEDKPYDFDHILPNENGSYKKSLQR